MRSPGLRLAAAALAALLIAEAPAPVLRSGIYEGLLLAVAPDGTLSGYYREQQGQGVTKTCTFSLSGHATGPGVVPVTTTGLQAFPGTLAASEDGVRLAVPNGRQHPGCGLVLLPQVAEGLELGQTRKTDWIALDRVNVARALLHVAAADGQRPRAFVVRGDVVGVLGTEADWVHVEYVNTQGKLVPGWVHASEVAPVVAPGPG